MRPDRLIRDYFGTQLFITTSGHFSTPALLCAMTEISSDSIMFSIDYPFESIPNGCVWWDEFVSRSVAQRDLVRMGRSNALKVLPRLKEGEGSVHGLKEMTVGECRVGGLNVERGEKEYGRYNEEWSRRMEMK